MTETPVGRSTGESATGGGRPGGLGGSAVLTAVAVSKSFRDGYLVRRGKAVLVDAALSLQPGEVVGLVGENGSGKTTFMRILVGDLSPDAGAVVRHGVIGYCPQQPQVYPRLTCDEHFDLFGAAYRLTTSQVRDSRANIYAALGFERYARVRTDRLSGGTLAKLNLGLALLPDPPVLLLDEPYAGFDWDTYQRFWRLVVDRRARGLSVLIVSHFVEDAARFDRIVEVREGRTWSR